MSQVAGISIAGFVRRAVVTAVGEVLARADAEIVALSPACKACGACCRFEEHGHQLWVTGVELIRFAEGMAHSGQDLLAVGAKGCPYQVANLCTARAARPLGCRVYFCDPGAARWQNDLYERYHAQFKAIHERFDLEYVYVEWREGLRMIAAKQYG